MVSVSGGVRGKSFVEGS
jgi:hypothetical protein